MDILQPNNPSSEMSPDLQIRANYAPFFCRPLINILNPLKYSWLEWTFFLCFSFYAFICVVVYFDYVVPWIGGNSEIRIGADSDRYWQYATEAQSNKDDSLISASQNWLGPVTIARILDSGFAVMGFNFALFLISFRVAGSIPGTNKGFLGFLWLLNAELMPALTTLNKEIFALLAAALTAKYLCSRKRSKLLLCLAMVCSLFARWEMLAILILYFLLTRFTFRNRPRLALSFLIGAITVVYPFTFRILGVDPSVIDYLMQGANTILTLNKIQNAFGFPLVVIPKIFMEMAGRLGSPTFYTSNPAFMGISHDPQQEVFQPLGCLAMLIVFIHIIWTRRMKLDHPLIFLSIITLIVTAATPFVQPRYLYGVYTLLCIELAHPTFSSISEKSVKSRKQRENNLPA